MLHNMAFAEKVKKICNGKELLLSCLFVFVARLTSQYGIFEAKVGKKYTLLNC